METSSHTIGISEEQEVLGRVGMLRIALAPHGYAHVLEGLPEDADDRTLMGRLIEMGPGLDAEGEKHVTSSEFAALVAASRFVSSEHRDALLSRVRSHAYDPASPHRMMAHEALAPVDAASAALLQAHRKAQREELRAQANIHVRGCCGGNDF